MNGLVIRRCFGCCNVYYKKSVVGRSKSSTEWLTRQLKDPYVEMAKMQNYRCRSAFKLLEINDRYNILKEGMCVIDCGAAPGSWTQVATKLVNSSSSGNGVMKGRVISIDRLPIHDIEGATILGGCDFTTQVSQSKIIKALDGREVDIIMSDMAPNATGVKQQDHDAILMLAYSVVRFSFGISCVGGSLLIKLWDGGGTKKFEQDLLRFYSSVKRIKPPSSRSDSAEIFILARDFHGISNKS